MALLKFKTTRFRYWILFPVSFLAVLAIWSLLSYGRIVKPFFLPSPDQVFMSAIKLFTEYAYLLDIWTSLKRILWGFLLSALLGIPLGLLLGINKDFEAAIEPFVDFIRYMPVAGFIPLAILWLGIGDSQKVAIIFIGTFFQLVPMVMNSVSSIPDEFLDTARTLGARDSRIFRRVIIPYAMPDIFDSLRVSIGISWTYLVVAEIVAAGSGIGHVIIQAQRYLKTGHIFVGIITVGVLGLATDYAFKFFKPILFPWTRS